MNKQKQTRGFTIAEMLIALVIMGILLAAMAVAFDASAKNYAANEGISKTMNTARAALLRITTELRTAQGVAVPDNTRCSLVTFDGRDITYSLDPDEDKPGKQALYLKDNSNAANPKHVLCRNVIIDNGKSSFVAGGPASAVRNVRIVLTLTDDKGNNSQTFAAAAVVRRNL